MSENQFSHPACHFAGSDARHKGPGHPVCCNALPGGACAIRDLMTLYTLYEGTTDSSPLSRPYFTDALAHFIARDCAKGGAINDACAHGIRSFVTAHGDGASAAGMDLIVHLLETDGEVSDELGYFALEQVMLALCEDRGLYRDMRPVHARGMTTHDLRFINRIFKSFIRRGRRELLPRERRLMMRIDAETCAEAHHPGWAKLMELLHAIPAHPSSVEPAARRPWLRLNEDRRHGDIAASG